MLASSSSPSSNSDSLLRNSILKVGVTMRRIYYPIENEIHWQFWVCVCVYVQWNPNKWSLESNKTIVDEMNPNAMPKCPVAITVCEYTKVNSIGKVSHYKLQLAIVTIVGWQAMQPKMWDCKCVQVISTANDINNFNKLNYNLRYTRIQYVRMNVNEKKTFLVEKGSNMRHKVKDWLRNKSQINIKNVGWNMWRRIG